MPHDVHSFWSYFTKTDNIILAIIDKTGVKWYAVEIMDVIGSSMYLSISNKGVGVTNGFTQAMMEYKCWHLMMLLKILKLYLLQPIREI